jgi:hypothetical protein
MFQLWQRAMMGKVDTLALPSTAVVTARIGQKNAPEYHQER